MVCLRWSGFSLAAFVAAAAGGVTPPRGNELNEAVLKEDASADASCGLLQIDASASSVSKAPHRKRDATAVAGNAAASPASGASSGSSSAAAVAAAAAPATARETKNSTAFAEAAASHIHNSSQVAHPVATSAATSAASAAREPRSLATPFSSALLEDLNGTSRAASLDKTAHNGTATMLVSPQSSSSAEFVTKVRSADADSTELTDPDPAVEVPDFAKAFPVKNKVVLMFLEMFPIFGPFGIDRFYAGDTTWGIVKLVVSLATCLAGGLIWGYIDAMIVIINALRMQPYIYFVGFKAQFSQDELVPAWWLALFTLIFHFACFCCCGSDPGRKRFRRAWQAFKKQDPKKEGNAQSSQQAPAAATLTGQA